ncbi:4-hydroxy-tetrahydrodipicolinate synthase [Clostridium sp. AF36-4]|uniref:4-hydroxy-tetrahydrodipicolinate synthase n=1 Tax=Clostridium sp. AF36-4 TaxID=2293015 RepID=UPI000E3F7F3B|nr:4-hydroxy-tetrahydrodipicolinate synthase [Clostridium sp. AF36-4]RGF57332.1 4-hydroxy-tetrahydrodipicolinate synthase [Clostridium sp. AF36-4]
MAIFTGAGVALITPMNDDGSVNYEKLRELLEFHVANETDAIIICGTTGEASTLSDEEHLECIRFACEVINKRIPVIAGTGSNCTQSAIELSKEAEKSGVDGLLLVTPYYNKATQNGLKAHYKAIAKEVNVPIILYNVPSRTGTRLAPQTVVDLCHEVPNIVGVKDATGDISEVAELMSLAKGTVDVYSGNDDQIVPVLSLGGKGVISVLSNILPKETHDMVASYLDGDVAKSCEMQLKYFDLVKALFCEVNPIPVKKALNLMGMEVGSLRLPLTEMEDANAKRLEEEMRKAGVIK